MATIAYWAGILKSKDSERQQAWADSFSAEDLLQACRDENHAWRNRFWTPLQTLWTFLLQVLHPGSCCRAAVAMALGEGAAADESVEVSPDASAYCQARKRLPAGVVRRCFRTVADRLREKVGSAYLWRGRHIWVVDGSSCSMPETPQLQEAFAQPSGQQPGCGFPVATIVAMFSWATGAVMDLTIGAYRDSELTLWRGLWGLLAPGEIVLADRFYCTYADIVGVARRGCTD